MLTTALPCPELRRPPALRRARSTPNPGANSTGGGGAMMLPGADLAGLLEDAWALALAEEGPITRFLDLLR